jgi:hypothetical protein
MAKKAKKVEKRVVKPIANLEQKPTHEQMMTAIRECVAVIEQNKTHEGDFVPKSAREILK